jgi:hypothetical protein
MGGVLDTNIIILEEALYSGKRELSSLFWMSYFTHEDDSVQEGILDQEEERFVNQDFLRLLKADRTTWKINEFGGVELWEMAQFTNFNKLNYFYSPETVDSFWKTRLS